MRLRSFVPVQETFQIDSVACLEFLHCLVNVSVRSAQIGFHYECVGLAVLGSVEVQIVSFAAGAMLYVVVEELIPEASTGKHTNLSTIGFAIGFVLMMVLDVVMG